MSRSLRLCARLALCASVLAPAAEAAPGDGWLTLRARTPWGSVSVGTHGGHEPRSKAEYRYTRGHRHHAACRYVDGRYETALHRTWVPPRAHEVWVEPKLEVWFDSCGTRHTRVLRAGYVDVRHEPGRWEVREERVWRPGGWTCGSLVPH